MRYFHILLFSIIGFNALSQDTFLTIYKSSDTLSPISYPPGTVFELRDTEGALVLDNTQGISVFDIEKAHILEVSPDYKESKDLYKLSSGKLVIAKAPRLQHNERGKRYRSMGITLKKTLFDSQVNRDTKNLLLEFSDGVRFTYTDGVVEATQHGVVLKIEGKYLVYNQAGVHKISFNPKNGVVYWVYEPHSK